MCVWLEAEKENGYSWLQNKHEVLMLFLTLQEQTERSPNWGSSVLSKH